MVVELVQVEVVKKGYIELDIDDIHVYGVETAGRIFKQEIGSSLVEIVGLLCLDYANRIINYSNIAIGNSENVEVSIAQIFRIALLSGACKIVIAHNHPGGILEITNADIFLTKKIWDLAKAFKISLIDSLVVGTCEEVVSIREKIGEHYE